MPFQPWFAILICIILCLSGCMKAVEKKVTVPVPEKKIIGRARQAPTILIFRKNTGISCGAPKRTTGESPRYFWPLPADMRRRGKRGGCFTFWTGRQRPLSVKQGFLRRGAGLLQKGPLPDADRSRARGSSHCCGREAKNGQSRLSALFRNISKAVSPCCRANSARARELLSLSLQDNTVFQTDVHFLQLEARCRTCRRDGGGSVRTPSPSADGLPLSGSDVCPNRVRPVKAAPTSGMPLP